MKIKLISGEFCSRCHLLAPLLKQWCEKNWYSYEEKDVKETTQEELWDATMLPIIRFDDKQMDYDEVLAIISK